LKATLQVTLAKEDSLQEAFFSFTFKETFITAEVLWFLYIQHKGRDVKVTNKQRYTRELKRADSETAQPLNITS
jgi:hypothetical protein